MWAMSQNQAARTRPGGLMSSQPPSVVFSKCTFFGGRLGQRQRLVPAPISVTERAWEPSSSQSPNPPLLLAMGGARAMNCTYLCPVGL